MLMSATSFEQQNSLERLPIRIVSLKGLPLAGPATVAGVEIIQPDFLGGLIEQGRGNRFAVHDTIIAITAAPAIRAGTGRAPPHKRDDDRDNNYPPEDL